MKKNYIHLFQVHRLSLNKRIKKHAHKQTDRQTDRDGYNLYNNTTHLTTALSQTDTLLAKITLQLWISVKARKLCAILELKFMKPEVGVCHWLEIVSYLVYCAYYIWEEVLACTSKIVCTSFILHLKVVSRGCGFSQHVPGCQSAAGIRCVRLRFCCGFGVFSFRRFL